jgi:hypothetical protein
VKEVLDLTTNQIVYQQLLETQRSNKAREDETIRSNVAKETENLRSNLAKELETERSNREREKETNRHNVSSESIEGIKAGSQLASTVLNGVNTAFNALKLF